MANAKKGKGKKATDPNEASKLIAAKISQLELDAAGEKDQEAEIGMSPANKSGKAMEFCSDWRRGCLSNPTYSQRPKQFTRYHTILWH